MEGFSTLTHQNKTIYYIDFTDVGKSKEKSIQLFKYYTTVLVTSDPLPKSVLSITNVTNLVFDMEILKVFKEEADKTAQYEKKAAVIGMKGILRAAYNFVVGLTNPWTKIKDSLEEAKEWLVSD